MVDLANVSLLTATLVAMGLSLILMIIIPVLPGQLMIWLASLLYGVLSEWETLSMGVFLILTVLMVIASLIDAIAGWVGARKGGASWVGVALGIITGLIGMIFFNAIGAIVGTIIGIMGYEFYLDGDWSRAWKAAAGYLGGLLVSLIARFAFSVAMIGIFMWQVL